MIILVTTVMTMTAMTTMVKTSTMIIQRHSDNGGYENDNTSENGDENNSSNSNVCSAQFVARACCVDGRRRRRRERERERGGGGGGGRDAALTRHPAVHHVRSRAVGDRCRRSRQSGRGSIRERCYSALRLSVA